MFDEKHMKYVAKELRETFDFFLSDKINPKSISIDNTYMDDLWCIVIDNWLTIVPCMVEFNTVLSTGRTDAYELQEITVKSNYPNEPDWIDYAIIGAYQGKTNIIDAALKYILNNATEAYEENKYYEQMAREDKTMGVW